MFNCQRKCVSKWSSPYLLINLILWMRTTWSHAFTKLTEQDRLMGYSEVFTFLFDPIECNKTSYVHKCETDILVEKLPEWTWMLLHDRRWGSFSPRTSWIHSLHKKMWWPPDVLWPPRQAKQLCLQVIDLQIKGGGRCTLTPSCKPSIYLPKLYSSVQFAN